MVHAEMTFLQLVKLNPVHSGGLLQLARVLVDSLKAGPEEVMKECTLRRAMDYYERHSSLAADVSYMFIDIHLISPPLFMLAVLLSFLDCFFSLSFPSSLQPSSALLEYLQVVNALGGASDKVRDHCSYADLP